MTSKADLAKENEKTRRVKEEDEAVKEKAKETVHDIKKGVKDLKNKTKDMDLEDAPDRLIPSVEKVDEKIVDAEVSLEKARTSKVGEKDLTRYPKIQQIFTDAGKILEDNRELLQNKTEDGTLSDAAHHACDLACAIRDQSTITLDKLWSNWAALLTVVAGTGAGSWKEILQESGNLINQLRSTQDFVQILNDLQRTLSALTRQAKKDLPVRDDAPLSERIDAVGDRIDQLDAEWEKQRNQLMEDWKRIWTVLNESPLWKQLVARGKAIKEKASEVGKETKEQIKESADKVSEDDSLTKLKEDFKNILQLIIGKDGPSVQPFLDYCSGAYSDIVENDEFSKWADQMSDCFDKLNQNLPENQAAYDKQVQEMYDSTKNMLDNTIRNENLKMALRESRKLIKAAKKDPATKKLLEDTNKLIKHVSDKKGVNLMDPQLLNEIRAVVVPLLLDHFDNAPLPDFHGHDRNALGTFDYTLSEIRLGLSGLIPSKVKIEFRYKAEANPAELQINNQKMLMYLEASDIQVAFKDVKWVYNRHTIPRFTDSGTIDLATAGKGIVLKLKAQIHDYQPPEHAHNLTDLLTPPHEQKMFTVLHADCDIDDFHVRVSDTGAAGPFYEMLAGIWGKKIKARIETLVEEKLNLLADKFNSQLYDICRRATQPTLAQETKDALLSAGKTAGEKIKETATEVQKSLQSM